MGVQESRELAQLESRRQKLKTELGSRASARDDAIKAHDAALCRLQAVEKSIDLLLKQAQTPVITEHAMLRYLEQVHGLDLSALQQEILTAARAQAVDTLPTCRVPIGDGAHLVVENRAVRNVVRDSSKSAPRVTTRSPSTGTAAAPAAVQRKEKPRSAPRGPKPAQRRREDREDGASR